MARNDTYKNARNSSFELLRIISMLLIVFYHFAIHGGFKFDVSISITHFWYNFIRMGGKVGVDLFILISGYYLIANKEVAISIDKVIKYIGQVFFYSVVIFIVGCLVDISNWGIKSFIKAFFPISFSTWWFASSYFVMYLLHPYINKLLINIDKSLYQKLLALLIICWSIVPTLTTASYGGNALWFVTLYALSGYIRLYGLNSKFTAKYYFLFFLVCSCLTYLSSVIFILLGNKWSVFAKYVPYFFGEAKITTLLISVSLFMTFAMLKLNYCKWINVLGSATFGVYLIHDNTIIRSFLWINLFKNAHYQERLVLIPYSLIVVAAVYIICTCIELLRQAFIEKPLVAAITFCFTKTMIPFKKSTIKLRDFVFGE
jgi:surface polysaccharide O-acyltransferase-like enzyme